MGVDKVREFKGVMASHRIERGQFVGTSGFTPDAEAFASANGINLLDKNKLLGLIARRQPEEQTALLDIALEGEYWKPTCASCSVKMTKRKSQRSGRLFWGPVINDVYPWREEALTTTAQPAQPSASTSR